jgi:hypothetical protein
MLATTVTAAPEGRYHCKYYTQSLTHLELAPPHARVTPMHLTHPSPPTWSSAHVFLKSLSHSHTSHSPGAQRTPLTQHLTHSLTQFSLPHTSFLTLSPGAQHGRPGPWPPGGLRPTEPPRCRCGTGPGGKAVHNAICQYGRHVRCKRGRDRHRAVRYRTRGKQQYTTPPSSAWNG